MAKSDKLYSKSPKIERDGDGKPGISRPTEADAENMGIGGDNAEGEQSQMPVETHQVGERREMRHRHVQEHLAQHHRHEVEHSTHKGDKKELFKKHEEEHKHMQDRHHAELKEMHGRQSKSTSAEE